MSVLDQFSDWKQFLANKLDEAKKHGMSSTTISNVAHHVGDYLHDHVKPENKEEKMLQQLWSVANEEEQQAIANIMIKLVQNNK